MSRCQLLRLGNLRRPPRAVGEATVQDPLLRVYRLCWVYVAERWASIVLGPGSSGRAAAGGCAAAKRWGEKGMRRFSNRVHRLAGVRRRRRGALSPCRCRGLSRRRSWEPVPSSHGSEQACSSPPASCLHRDKYPLLICALLSSSLLQSQALATSLLTVVPACTSILPKPNLADPGG
uniref:Uncharacterized protein n=1 Tax=Setaria italica TaxID=4555 RepID=K4AFT6_SETIT